MTRTTTLAVAADYADALMTARRAKNVLFLVLAFLLVAQLVLFSLIRFNLLKLEDRAGITPVVPAAVIPPAAPAAAPATDPTTEPAAASDTTAAGTTPPPPARSARTVSVDDILRYVVPVINFLGVTLAVVLGVVLLLLTGIMLVGRLVGVSHVTSAFIWSVVLIVFLFPWQAFLIGSEHYPVGPASSAYSVHDSAAAAYDPQPAFKVPGSLYTYPELRQDLQSPDTFAFSNGNAPRAIVKWVRYAAFPVVVLLILLAVQTKSGRGLRFALGEADIQVDVATGPAGQL